MVVQSFLSDERKGECPDALTLRALMDRRAPRREALAVEEANEEEEGERPHLWRRNIISPRPRHEAIAHVHAPPISGPHPRALLPLTPHHVICPPCCSLLIGVGPCRILRRSCPSPRPTRPAHLLGHAERQPVYTMHGSAPRHTQNCAARPNHTVGHVAASRNSKDQRRYAIRA